jgi:hypothetical protein
MKTFLVALLCSVFGGTQPHAAVIAISAVLEGDAGLGPGDGDTLDYLTFEVLSSSDVTLTGDPPRGGIEYLLAEYIGREDEFGDLSASGEFRLVWDCLGPLCQDSPPMILSRRLDPGVYVIITNMRFDTSYDHFDGYVPVNPEGGGFVRATYSYTLEGDLRGLEFREGNLDGTFTVTRIPEPGVAGMVGLALAGLARRKRSGKNA